MTCKDCIHYEVCKNWAWDTFGADSQFPYKETCERFKMMNETETLNAEREELKHTLKQRTEENRMLHIKNEDLFRENIELEKRNEFLSGMVEAYKHCIEIIKR